MMDRFNKWYDQLPEPWRFLLFMVPMTFILIVFQWGLTMKSLPLSLIGIALLLLMVNLACTRVTRSKRLRLIAAAFMWLAFAVVSIIVALR